MDGFEGLKKEFNIEAVEEDVNSTINSANEKIEEIRDGIKEQKYSLADKEFLMNELQDLIESDREVMDSLKDLILGGAAAPNFYMLYATLSKSVRDNVAQLTELEKIITDYQVVETGENFKEKSLEMKERLATKRLTADKGQQVPGQITQNNTYIFNPKEQFEVMKQAEVQVEPVELPKFDLS
jgi:hypothetical protein